MGDNDAETGRNGWLGHRQGWSRSGFKRMLEDSVADPLLATSLSGREARGFNRRSSLRLRVANLIDPRHPSLQRPYSPVKDTVGSQFESPFEKNDRMIQTSEILDCGEGPLPTTSVYSGGFQFGAPPRTPGRWERDDAIDFTIHLQCRSKWMINPVGHAYRGWWAITVIAALLSSFLLPVMVAFGDNQHPWPPWDFPAVLEYTLIGIFIADMCVNFRKAYFHGELLVDDIFLVSKRYLRGMFLVDLLGVIPLDIIVLAATGHVNTASDTANYISLLRLLRLVRCYRVWDLFVSFEYNVRVSFLAVTLLRNLTVVLLVTNFSACGFYFIARQLDVHHTYIGHADDPHTPFFKAYVSSLYWALVTQTTVGYGDLTPTHPAGMIWDMLFMLTNVVLGAYIIGTITLLVVKADEKTGQYRDKASALSEFSRIHKIPSQLKTGMEDHLRLHFDSMDVSDESVLSVFPGTIRRKILRNLYMPEMEKCYLFKNCHQRFLDAILACARIEVFMPKVELLSEGDHVHELLLVVGGTAEVVLHGAQDSEDVDVDSELGSVHASCQRRRLVEGEPFGEVAFFTEVPQLESVRTRTVCRVLVISRSDYVSISGSFPRASRSVLHSLLERTREVVMNTFQCTGKEDLDARLQQVGQDRDYSDRTFKWANPEVHSAMSLQLGNQIPASRATWRQEQVLSNMLRVQLLVEQYVAKQDELQIMQFLSAAARGDGASVRHTLQQSFVADSTDCNGRTALMLASRNGHPVIVRMLLAAGADPNRCDFLGNTALSEACFHKRDDVIDILSDKGGSLGKSFEEMKIAPMLCRAVFEGDAPLLRRLLTAGAVANSGDYDRRTALHISASEGNLVCAKLLVEMGNADINVKDRWGNTPLDEALASSSDQVVKYLQKFQTQSASRAS